MSSSLQVIRKDISALKRPDLKGRFECFSCSQTFQHAASLKRHRARSHSTEHTCLICNQSVGAHETIREHLERHGIKNSYTCSCCNWTFPSKSCLIDHMSWIRETGQPGEMKPLAISCHAPGSLLQSAIQGEESLPLPKLCSKKRSSVTVAEQEPKPKISRYNRSSITPSDSRSSSPLSSDFTINNGKTPELENVNQLTVADFSTYLIASHNPGNDLSDAVAKLSTLRNNAPQIEIYDDAICYIFNKIQFSNEQIINPIVWQHIIETAVSFISK